MAAAKPFWLDGNFAPITEERTITDLEVTGAIPPELSGRFFRNGANPKSGVSGQWFKGNGMIHGVELEKGKANWYRNRYVKTPALDNENAPRVREDGTVDRSVSLANTHVIAHGGKILALEEGAFPWELSPELDTVGCHDFGGKLDSAMTAHPRICPETGELLFFGYSATPPYLVYHRASADGTLVQSEEIEVKGPTMMHDWNVTRNHVIFMDLPMIFDLELAAQGGMPLRWSDDYGARLGVMPRDGTNEDVVWYEIDPCYVFHPMNSYEDGEKIVIDVSRFPKLAFGPNDKDGEPATLHRWIIDREAGKVSDQPLDDRPADFPRIADECVGLKHRYGYMMATGGQVESFGQEIFKYDLQTGASQTCTFGPGFAAGEPVFAKAGNGAEDEGWLLSYLYDAARDKSDLVILDAQNIEKGPVARVHLPTRVPNGFHGSWIADA
jgi:carotenoid cleavage dioxygenase-like enzyme